MPAAAPAVPETAADLEREWGTDPRWRGVRRSYTAADVVRLRGQVREEHTLAGLGAQRLWQGLQEQPYLRALGALTGNQAVQMVRAGLKAIYLSGWQVAADANLAGHTYPDQSLYPANSVPAVVRRINNALLRAGQVTTVEATIDPSDAAGHAQVRRAADAAGHAQVRRAADTDWLVPIVADAEAGFGGPLNAYELMMAMIVAGAAGVHWEDQLASEKKCGHLGGKVLVPTGQHIRTLNAARLAADVAGVPTVILARTDAQAATLLTTDVDERDRPFLTGDRTAEGFYRVTGGIEPCIARGLAYAPYADLLWMETSTPDLEVARRFAEAVKAHYPDQMLAYNCSPSFNWRKHLDDDTIAKFQNELGHMGYKFQFITLAGFHVLNYSTFDLARGYASDGMPAYVDLQEREFAAEAYGYTAVKHQREVGTGYFDLISTVLNPAGETTALRGSTEEAQFS
jgi:isocitrate lyase